MNPIDAISISTTGLASPPSAQAPMPREVSGERASAFKDMVNAESRAVAPAGVQPEAIGLDIEKVLMSNMPAADASPAEFAVGMLRAQVKVAQAAIAIELVNKTTQNLSQGVQSLATRS